tara:strand:- start:264 stop:491 length:228 start_codon:yes stop_codon:yes gene_type:complete
MIEYRIVELLKEIKGMLTGNSVNDNWLNINEASEYCGVSPSTLRRNIKDNSLKASKRLGKLLFKKADLENWLTNK